mmetsp:Transcript_17921/g.26837  ORF Transcript_17921/g.26837 Transcript_17921/m.26837 type:complete len:486 (+) Transcript_17921:22-1479(+)
MEVRANGGAEEKLLESKALDGADDSVAKEKLDKENRRIFWLTMAVLFTNYSIATFLSPFFPNYAEDNAISSTFVGIIFAAYPMGITIMSAFGTGWMKRLGVRKCVLGGMLSLAIFMFLFGITPTACKAWGLPKTSQKWIFLLFYFCAGLSGATSETACIMLATYRFRERSGSVSASIGTVCGIGCMVGPPLGGILYEFGGHTTLPSFLFPFMIFTMASILIAAALPFAVPRESQSMQNEPQETVTGVASLSEILSKSRVITLVGMGFNGALVASLDPTLAYRATKDPLNYGSSLIGFMFTASSLSYTLTSIPTGYILDKYQGQASVFKLVQAGGFLSLFLCFAMLGPIKQKNISTVFNNAPSIWIAMFIKGIGSCGGNAVYPDLIVGIGENEEDKIARISGLWNATYAIGWALGPLLGGVLYDNLGFDGYATAVALTALVICGMLSVFSIPKINNWLQNSGRLSDGTNFYTGIIQAGELSPQPAA